MQMKLYAGVAFAALMIPGAAYAQSTGSIDSIRATSSLPARATTDVAGVEDSRYGQDPQSG